MPPNNHPLRFPVLLTLTLLLPLLLLILLHHLLPTLLLGPNSFPSPPRKPTHTRTRETVEFDKTVDWNAHRVHNERVSYIEKVVMGNSTWEEERERRVRYEI